MPSYRVSGLCLLYDQVLSGQKDLHELRRRCKDLISTVNDGTGIIREAPFYFVGRYGISLLVGKRNNYHPAGFFLQVRCFTVCVG
jgi:hypothetical protein